MGILRKKFRYQYKSGFSHLLNKDVFKNLKTNNYNLG